jgi:hypothetical protein
MGAEFLKKTRATHAKSIDSGRVQLGTPDLFTRTPEEQPRCAVASVTGSSNLKTGETLIVEPKGAELIASRGNSEVACIKNPPADVMQAILSKGGVAKGEVQKVNKLSNTADIALC